MRILGLLIIVLTTTACGHSDPLIRPEPRIPPDSAMRPCKPLSEFTGTTAEDLINKSADWFKEHNVDCLLPHQELIDWIKAGQVKK